MAPPVIPPDALVLLDYVGIAVFAVSGALLAAEKKQTLVTFIFFAAVTGVGGGTVRDLLIGAPVFWMHTNTTLLICIGAGVGVWFLSRRAIAERALLWFDASACRLCPYGAPRRCLWRRPRPAFAMGVMTACVGGIIRDVLAGEPSILMRRAYVPRAPSRLWSRRLRLRAADRSPPGCGLAGFLAAPPPSRAASAFRLR
jgi:uncharacterized membrane protein YeiH